MSHTPGPWQRTDTFVCAVGDSGVNRFQLQVNPGGFPHSVDVATIEECEANARLIAAAPDLLEACKAVLATLEETELHGQVLWIEPPYQASGVHETVFERLSNIIAQVEGDE